MTHAAFREKILELIASLMVLLPAMGLLAWEDRLSNPGIYWGILSGCCAIVLAALVARDRKKGSFQWKRFMGSCGGFVAMLCFLVYQSVHLLA